MGRQPFPLRGFNGLAGIVDEPIVEETGNMQGYFLDGLHFRNNFAEIIMDGVWGESTDIGTRLDAQSLDSYALRVQQLSHQFNEQNQSLTGNLRGTMNLPAR